MNAERRPTSRLGGQERLLENDFWVNIFKKWMCDNMGGRAFWAEGSASIKTLRWACAWSVPGTPRWPVVGVQWVKERDVGNGIKHVPDHIISGLWNLWKDINIHSNNIKILESFEQKRTVIRCALK